MDHVVDENIDINLHDDREGPEMMDMPTTPIRTPDTAVPLAANDTRVTILNSPERIEADIGSLKNDIVPALFPVSHMCIIRVCLFIMHSV